MLDFCVHRQEVPVYVDKVEWKTEVKEVYIDRVIEKVVEIPVDRVIEKIVEVFLLPCPFICIGAFMGARSRKCHHLGLRALHFQQGLFRFPGVVTWLDRDIMVTAEGS
jgi:hypothetical protein